MKNFLYLAIALSTVISSLVFGQQGRGSYGSDPIEILDTIVNDANEDYKIQESPLERIDERQGGLPSQYKIANTLDSIRQNIARYIQRIVFIGLTIAVIGLIYLGFLMVTNSVSNAGKIDRVKKWIQGIVIGIIVLTWFYAIIRLIVALLTSLFGTPGGDSGFN